MQGIHMNIHRAFLWALSTLLTEHDSTNIIRLRPSDSYLSCLAAPEFKNISNLLVQVIWVACYIGKL